MKAISIREAEGQLGQLVAEACRGETIVLTDGDNRVTLAPRILDLEVDSPELEAELLKAANGPFSPYHEANFGKLPTGCCGNGRPYGKNEIDAATR